MNKKGFTLLEVVVSVVLVSLVLTAMLSALVKLKRTYEVSNENTDSLIFTSSLTRIINNDFEQNGGISYIECSNSENSCDILLNNGQKRRISVYETFMGYKVEPTYTDSNGVVKSNKIIKVKKLDGTLNKYISDPNDLYYTLQTETIYCEPASKNLSIAGSADVVGDDGNSVEMLVVYKIDHGGSGQILCSNETLATTLKYEDRTGIEDNAPGNNIYLKTLKLQKGNEIIYDKGAYTITGKTTTLGYTFGRISYNTVTYNNFNKTDYENTISTITIEVNNSLDQSDTTKNIYLTSESTHKKNTQAGRIYCYALDTYNKNIANIRSDDPNLCEKYGITFMKKRTTDGIVSYEKTTKIKLPYQADASGNKMSNPEYICEGYYHDVNNNGEYDATTDVIVVDENGNIKVNTTYFTSQSNVAIRAKWEPNIP